jgi:hypothetical protein
MTAIFDAIELAAPRPSRAMQKRVRNPLHRPPPCRGEDLLEACCAEDVVAGILHDTVEDTP